MSFQLSITGEFLARYNKIGLILFHISNWVHAFSWLLPYQKEMEEIFTNKFNNR